MRRPFFVGAAILVVGLALAAYYFAPALWWSFALVLPLLALAIRDVTQERRAVLRNFPIIGHFRYLFEAIRPEINQYFVESNTDGRPFDRLERSVVYQRAKRERDTLPFGTQRDVYRVGYEWISHSVLAKPPVHEIPRVVIGADQCAKPYSSALLNVSAMSFGSLSSNAVMALNLGAKAGGFAHNTGEGGLSPYHLQGGDLIWQIGTGYFGCRTEDGRFDPKSFQEKATLECVRMIEVKLSQGAKPGHGGILPAAKVTEEISKIRNVPMGKDVLSPPAHTAFRTPLEMLHFIDELRRLSGGKPVGIKLCVGNRAEFLALCKAMVETGSTPDYVAVDGGEGGTGAAPLEFSNSVGTPLTEGLLFVHNALVGFDLRKRVKVIASGRIITGFHMAARMALGADVCASARGMMFSIGCIQALRCNTNECPVGVATQKPDLVAGLVVEPKSVRAANFQHATVESLLEIVGAAGLDHPSQLEPRHLQRRVSSHEVRSYDEIYEFRERGALLSEPIPESFARDWYAASSSTFERPREPKALRAVQRA